MNPQKSSAVLITGCSSGIGEACALDLAARGMKVFAGVRKAEDGQRLRDRARGRLEPVLLDVTDASMIRDAAAELKASLGDAGLAGLVNNAGILVSGPLELLATADFRRQLEVNVLGTHAVTQAMLPLVRKAGGRIVLIGSISGRIALPYYGAYAASKHALEAMADALRMELRMWKIRVALVEPDAVSTPLWANVGSHAESDPAALYAEQIGRLHESTLRTLKGGTSLSAVVQAVRHALTARRPKTRYPVGLRARLASWGACRLPTSWMDWLLPRIVGLQ